MADAGWLSPAEAKDAKYPAITPEHSSLTGPAGYVVAQVEHELRAQGITDQELRTEGLRIVTTIDRDAQAAATAAMRAALGRAAADTRGALVSIQPGTGAIRAYYGGDRGYGFLDYARGSYPSGGTLRPFVSAATILGADTEDSARGGSGGRGARAALSLATSAGIRKSAAGQKEIDAKDPHESADSVLSRYPVSPVELAAGMGTLAAGVRGDPHLVRSVQQGRATVYENQARGHRVDGPLSVSVIRTSGLYRKDSDWQALLPGGRWSSGNLGVVQAGPAKAQTSSTAWAAGLTPELSTAIWLGHDKNRPLLAKSGGPLDSRQTALTAWQAFAVHAGPGHQ
jgi:membrane peptidoglycan carboxypeptidase